MNYTSSQSRVDACFSFPEHYGRGRLIIWLLLALLTLPGLSGCNTQAIYGDSAYNPAVYWGRHVVERGDTLYSIAWRYGRDYRELGNANGISPPYNIYPGQVIRLDLRGTIPSGGSRVAASPRSPAETTRPRAAPKPQPVPQPQPKVTRKPDPAMDVSRQTQTVSNVNWRWPHVGTVIAKFSTGGKVNKGIDIAGNLGDPVRAAADGNVVYAGNGLLGYGNLIIINHNEHYLSAYAHNRRILVGEGQDVKQGQTIAELGNTGTDQAKLHFEIRRNGNPVDPIPYLPRR